MKLYLYTTAAIFGLLTVAHLWRIVAESRALASSPSFIVITALSAALCIWAVRLIRRPSSLTR